MFDENDFIIADKVVFIDDTRKNGHWFRRGLVYVRKDSIDVAECGKEFVYDNYEDSCNEDKRPSITSLIQFTLHNGEKVTIVDENNVLLD